MQQLHDMQQLQEGIHMFDSISVIIPVYNSQNSLHELHRRLSAFLENSCKDYEIIMIDDGSRDGSFSEIIRLHEMDNRVKAIGLDGNFGQQNVLMCGLRHARYEYIVTMDDDLQHPPEEIIKLLNALDQGYDLVYGIPSNKKHSFYRNIGTKLTDHLFNIICQKPKGIRVGSFRAMKRSIAELISQNNTSFVYISAIALKLTKNIGNVVVLHNERKYGKSNYNIIKLAKVFFKLFIYYSGIPCIAHRDNRPQYVLKNSYL